MGLSIAKINWCGLSMGGMVGMWLGANAANRIDKLILSNTSSYFPDKTMWDGRIKLVREKGLEGIVDANMERWFTKGFRDRAPDAMARMKKMFVATKVDGYVGCGEAIRDMDHRPLLSKITAATFVIAGKHDPATPLEGNEFIKQHIPGCKNRRPRGRAYRQYRAATGLRRYRAGIFAELGCDGRLHFIPADCAECAKSGVTRVHEGPMSACVPHNRTQTTGTAEGRGAKHLP